MADKVSGTNTLLHITQNIIRANFYRALVQNGDGFLAEKPMCRAAEQCHDRCALLT